jgi:metal-responsive CopG/Arc/MetJ family transcriptional regulator
MLGRRKVTIDKDLWEKIKLISDVAGYSSPDEFVIHALERQIAEFEDAETDEEIRKKLRGLGYIS